MELILVILFLQSMAFGLFCRYIAGEKKRSKENWFVLGFFFSILALIAIAVVPVNTRIDHSIPNPDLHVKCPDCRKFISKDTSLCAYCGCKLVSQKILVTNSAVSQEDVWDQIGLETKSGDLTPVAKAVLGTLVVIIILIIFLRSVGVIGNHIILFSDKSPQESKSKINIPDVYDWNKLSENEFQEIERRCMDASHPTCEKLSEGRSSRQRMAEFDKGLKRTQELSDDLTGVLRK